MPSVVSVRAAGAFRALRVNHSVVSVRAAGAFRALRVNHSVVSVFQRVRHSCQVAVCVCKPGFQGYIRRLSL